MKSNIPTNLETKSNFWITFFWIVQHPDCRFWGVDPSPAWHQHYRDFGGTVIPYAVGTKPGEAKLTLLIKKPGKHSYQALLQHWPLSKLPLTQLDNQNEVRFDRNGCFVGFHAWSSNWTNIEMSFAIVKGERKPHWKVGPVEVVPMHTMLDRYVGQRLMHFATIDLEGFEFPIMEEFRRGRFVALVIFALNFCVSLLPLFSRI